MGRVADATVLAPRRSDDTIAFATARSSNNSDGAVPPQPFNVYGHAIHVRGHDPLYSFNSLPALPQ